MNIEMIMALIGFAFAMLIVPGPNNLLLMSSGAAFGFRRTVPHLLGAVFGFNLLMVIAAIGLGGVMLKYPGIAGFLKLGGAMYLTWLGLRFIESAIGRHHPERVARKQTLRPFNTTEAALFQWINPSALVLAISSVGAFAGVADTMAVRLAILSTVFTVVALFATSAWVGLGASLSTIFEAPATGRLLRGGIGSLILFTAIFVFF